ncbi:MAG: hypothetical protein DWI03_09560 [Planctomycetota bacterium]|nr:MAG: hypothetical protein DWI03_09560 [Planctomycetota bacterium]
MIVAHRAFVLLVCLLAAFVASPSLAAGPRNPYSSFNLSGVNYGAQQWDRAQREGRRVWPYYNQPQRTTPRPAGMSTGIVSAGPGMVIQGGTVRSAQRSVRRWRR